MEYKDKEEIKNIVDKQLEDCDFLTCLSVRDVNYDPHPYTIGTKHITYACDHYGGILDNRILEKVKCAVSGCNLPYDKHTYDRVILLQFKKNPSEKELKDKLKEIADQFGKSDFSGFIFVETKEKFRVKIDT